MRLRSISESIMGSREYSPPSDAMNLMADFYIIELLSNGVKHVESHRTDNVSYEVKHVESVLLPHLKKFLLECLGLSIVSETSNVLYYTKIRGVDRPGYENPEGNANWLRDIIGQDAADTAINYDGYGNEEDRQAIAPFMAVVAKAGDRIFDNDEVQWQMMYGGKPWANACKLWLRLARANTIDSMKLAIDMVFQAQHNTGSILNKNYEFKGQWLPLLLNLKYDANDPEQLMRMCSPYVKKLVGYVLHNKYGRSLEGTETVSVTPERYYLELAQRSLSNLPGKVTNYGYYIAVEFDTADGHGDIVTIYPESEASETGKSKTMYRVRLHSDRTIGELVDLGGLRRVVLWNMLKLNPGLKDSL